MTALPAQRVEMIPIDRVNVVNPRVRNKQNFRHIVDNIAKLGLKKPITVSRRLEANGPFYDLVCGQGRLEAYVALGQTEVPALVVSADAEDCLVSSLVENCARRQHRALDLLQDLKGMEERGYSHADISRKTGLTQEYVRGVARLIDQGEQRLLRSVETGAIPISVAIDIAEAPDQDVQSALTNAYERGLLRGRKLLAARKLIELRRRRGKSLNYRSPRPREQLSADVLVKAYQEDADRKRTLIRRAEATSNRLLVITEGLRRLIADPAFVDVLEEEGLASLPTNLASRLHIPGESA